jgi:hypothetical protein
MEQNFQFRVMREDRSICVMEKIGISTTESMTRCAKCGKLLEPVVGISGRTELQCISCDDPAVKLAERPLAAPESPIAAEPAAHH